MKGRIWINNGNISKIINPIELKKFLNDNWSKGRIYLRK